MARHFGSFGESQFHFVYFVYFVGVVGGEVRLGENGCFKADYRAIRRHASTAEDTLCATVGEAAGPCNVASRLLASDAIGDCESVEDAHSVRVGLVWVGLG
jgi:hypothetical protein